MGYAAHMVENKITYRVLVRILEEKSHLEYAMYRWQKPEMYLKKLDGDSWTSLIWLMIGTGVVNSVIKFQVP
jgi:hypothetical protein